MEMKAGTGLTLVAPAPPEEAKEADNANPGEVEEVKAAQKESKTGKYGSTPAQGFTPPPANSAEAQEGHWLEVELKDDDGNPVPGEAFEAKMPDGRLYKGTLDRNGFARVEGVPAGQAEVRFPNMDDEAWEKA